LRTDNYDLGLTEMYEFCSYGLFEVIGIKSTALLSATTVTDLLAEVWGLPSPRSYVTGKCCWPSAKKLFQNALFRRMVSEDFPDLRDLAQRAAVAFVNTLPNIDIARPISSKVVFVGGITKKQVSVMEKPFADLYENARKGVVVFSLGSLVDAVKMPEQMKTDVLLAFSRFSDYDFIVKLAVSDEEREKFASSYPNVHFFDWIDQVNLLHHPKTKAFITHAGMNSLSEAAFAGTPVICIPIFADQHYNTAIALRKNIGIYLNKKHINVETVTDALQKVLNDPRSVCEQVPQKRFILGDKFYMTGST
uniref:UDP-glucuronosyltransferase n=1 Tax=Gongylonema pulchrum TaxID=637853 RepID=A0A183E1L1_9BILA